MEGLKEAQRITVYLNETDTWHGQNLAAVIVERARRAGLMGATVFKGSMGYGRHKLVHTSDIVDLSANLPVFVEIVDIPAAIERFVPEILELVGKNIVTVEAVQIYPPQVATESPTRQKSLVSQGPPVRFVMAEKPVTVHPETPVKEIARIFAEHHFESVPVVDSQGHILGIITDQDLAYRALNIQIPRWQYLLSGVPLVKKVYEQTLIELEKSQGKTASHVMTANPICIQAEDPLSKAAEQLLHHRIEHLPVLEGEKLVGMLTLSDVFGFLHRLGAYENGGKV
jgi:PII-like signaling protein/CBS domain-containing protein